MEGAGDFFNNLILKLSEAFLDLIDFDVFFGSCSSATYTRRRSRIAKPEVDKIMIQLPWAVGMCPMSVHLNGPQV